MALVFDIEWESFDDATKDQLSRWLLRESRDDVEFNAGLEDIKNGLGFSPLTGFIVAIGVFDTEKEKGAVFYADAPVGAPTLRRGSGETREDFEEEGIKYRALSEKEMLESFWEGAKAYAEFVSFNGRCFDAPFLAIRSAIYGVRPSKDLLEGRYLYQQRNAKHIDLLDQLSFYGALRRKGSLHLFCRAFDIESPKAGGTTGDDVAGLYHAGKALDIARYNAGDLRATAALYHKWRASLR